jgi:hypothetical protein
MPRTLAPRPLGSSAIWLALLLAVSSFGALGCPGNLDPALLPTGGAGTGGGARCDAVPILVAKCGIDSLCHDARASTPGNLDLITAPFDRLVGRVPDGTNLSQCAGVTTPYLVAGSDPATGLLLEKMKPERPCGEQMPTLNSVSASEIACITDWATGLTSP